MTRKQLRRLLPIEPFNTWVKKVNEDFMLDLLEMIWEEATNNSEEGEELEEFRRITSLYRKYPEGFNDFVRMYLQLDD